MSYKFSFQSNKEKYETDARINKLLVTSEVNDVLRDLDESFDSWSEESSNKTSKKG